MKNIKTNLLAVTIATMFTASANAGIVDFINVKANDKNIAVIEQNSTYSAPIEERVMKSLERNRFKNDIKNGLFGTKSGYLYNESSAKQSSLVVKKNVVVNNVPTEIKRVLINETEWTPNSETVDFGTSFTQGRELTYQITYMDREFDEKTNTYRNIDERIVIEKINETREAIGSKSLPYSYTYFNGINSTLTVTNGNSHFGLLGADFEVSADIYLDSYNQDKTAIIANRGFSTYQWLFGVQQGKVIFSNYYNSISGHIVKSSVKTIPLNQWTNVKFVGTNTDSATTTIEIFIDGILDSSFNFNNNYFKHSNQTIGIGYSNYHDDSYFNGYISNLKMIKNDEVILDVLKNTNDFKDYSLKDHWFRAYGDLQNYQQ